METQFNIYEKIKNEKGVTAVYVALMMLIFVGVAAFAIDIGYKALVRNQLQNAADAAALAACNHFYPRNPPALNPPPPPDWASASAEAANAVTINTADNRQLQVGVVVTGWWDITQSIPGSLWPNPVTNPPPNTPPSANYGPAVNVTITKTAGQNDGPILSFFGRILGVFQTSSGATATAVAASPGSVRPGAVPPVALAKEVVDNYYNVNNNPGNQITIGSPYMYPNSLAGQWTSFFTDNNDTTTIRDLISGGNPTALSTGDDIWIVPGVKDTLYDNKNQPSIDNTYAGKDVVLPIVDAIISDVTHSEVAISGFVGFHIVCAGKGCGMGNLKIIKGYFTTAPVYGNGPVGPHYGPVDRCRLCQ